MTIQTLYLTDNGACYCHDHLGATAKATGRDISGQPIQPITFRMVRESGLDPDTFHCEQPRCGAGLAAIQTV